MKREILIKDYWYELPDERIAKYPLPERDSSKLLVYKEGEITHSSFRNIVDFYRKKARFSLTIPR